MLNVVKSLPVRQSGLPAGKAGASGVKKILAACALLLLSNSLSAFQEGENMPNFGLPASDGNFYMLSGLLENASALVFSFFDSNCAPCRKELPSLLATEKKYAADKGVRFFMVSVGEDRETVKKCIKEWGITQPVLYDESADLAKQCSVVTGSFKNIPRTFVTDRNGRVTKIFKGYQEGLVKALSMEIDKAASASTGTVKTIRILYTNSANGIIESCDCPTNPYGGLVRRLTFFQKIAAPDIKISAGDFFSPNDEQIKNRYVAGIMAKLDYDAVCVGDQEFRAGAEAFQSILSEHELPIVNANMQLCDEKSCSVFGKPYIIKEVKGVKIGITGVTSESCFLFYPQKIKERLKITAPPREALAEIVPIMREKCDYVFALVHAGEKEVEEIAAAVKGIDVIFSGHTQTLTCKQGKPLIVQAGAAARYVGELTMRLSGGSAEYENKFFPLTEDIVRDAWGLSLSEKYLIEYKKSLEKFKQ
ncbi:MAG: redoxin family protein [Elusimicrobiota bacterium]|nr:redoxin family protein [Elusimicrobiota bacterium]